MIKFIDGKAVDDEPPRDGDSFDKLKESIKRNMEFNRVLETTTPVIPDKTAAKLALIKNTLRSKGMDSQQLEQAMERIKEILESS